MPLKGTRMRNAPNSLLARNAPTMPITPMKLSAGETNELLATLAHELRNPLGSLMNSLEIMKLAPANAAQVGRARATMERQLAHLKRLVDDVLDFSRMGRDLLELRKTDVNLGMVLEEAVEACRSTPAAAGRLLTVTLPPEPLCLVADADRLTQVFGNLLTNACKYTNPGGRVDVAVERWGSHVVVRVSDNGIGIPLGMLAKVFERFVQIDGLAERARGGLGLGLTLARQLVELHGGIIRAHSEGLGRGSEFIVRLPTHADRPVVFDLGRRRRHAATWLRTGASV
jgi:signal transduction histidine kinase